MKNTSLKHTNLKCIVLLMCIVFTANSFAQQTNLPKTQKADTVVTKKKALKKKINIKLNGEDGPFIFSDSLMYRVNSDNKLLVSPIFNRDSIIVKVDNIDKNEFFFSLNSKYTIPKTVYEAPEKMVVISDIEGNYEAFAGFLFSNKIIDENHNWIYNNGHLVLVGDFVDRGKNVTQVLWLIYKLDQQAKKQNGHVHFILGNHEILNFQGDHRYNRSKYINVAQEISQLKSKKEAIKFMYTKESELGKWLATKNVIEKIGDYIFVHAGLSPEILEYQLLLKDINKLVRTRFSAVELPKNKTINFLYSTKGPFWYRGLVKPRFEYDKIKATELEAVLKYYNSKKVVVGHTPVETISTGYNGSVIMTDVHHGNKKFSGKTKGLLIINNIEFVINDKGEKTLLK